jgi:hypothetical protein
MKPINFVRQPRAQKTRDQIDLEGFLLAALIVGGAWLVFWP